MIFLQINIHNEMIVPFSTKRNCASTLESDRAYSPDAHVILSYMIELQNCRTESFSWAPVTGFNGEVTGNIKTSITLSERAHLIENRLKIDG